MRTPLLWIRKRRYNSCSRNTIFGVGEPNAYTDQGGCYDVARLESILLLKDAQPGNPSIRSLQSLVENFLWVAWCTRPNITFAGHKAARQTHHPRKLDCKFCNMIAEYPSGRKNISLGMHAGTDVEDAISLESSRLRSGEG